MAYIKINGRKDPLAITNTQALKIKDKLSNLKRGDDEMIDLGVWFGSLNQIKSVELEYERKQPSEDYNRPLTTEERANAKAMMAKVRAGLESKGLLKSSFSPASLRCEECKCLMSRMYFCRHDCKKCLDKNPS